MLPFLRRMEHVQNFDRVPFDPIRNDVGGGNDFPRHGRATGAATFRELFEPLTALPDSSCFREHSLLVGVFQNVLSYFGEILKCVRGPADIIQLQRLIPTSRIHP